MADASAAADAAAAADGASNADAGSTPDAAAAPDGGTSQITFTNQRVDGTSATDGLVAYQDGDGPWQAVTGNGGVYTFTVSAARYGLFAACLRNDGSAFVSIGYFAVSDGGARFGLDACTGGAADEEGPATVSGTIRNAPEGDAVFISDGLTRTTVSVPGPYSIAALPGAGTLVVLEVARTGMVLVPTTFVDGQTLDIDLAAKFSLAEADLTLDLSGADYHMQTRYIDATGGQHRVDDNQTASGFVATRYRAVPAEHLSGGINTLFELTVDVDTARQVTRAFTTPVAQALDLPASFRLAAPPQIVTVDPYPIAQATLPTRAGASHYTVTYERTSAQSLTTSSWTLTYSAAWADALADSALVSRFPDLSGLPGWQEAFGLGDTGTIFWTASVATGPARLVPGAAPFGLHARSTAMLQDGDETTISTTHGSLP